MSTVLRDARVRSKQIANAEITCKTMRCDRLGEGSNPNSLSGELCRSQHGAAPARLETGGFRSTAKNLTERTGAHSCPVRSPVPMSRLQLELGSKNPLGLLPFIPGTAPQARQFTMKRTSRSLRSSRAHCEFTLNFTGSSQYKCEVLPNFTLPGSSQLQNPPGCPTSPKTWVQPS